MEVISEFFFAVFRAVVLPIFKAFFEISFEIGFFIFDLLSSNRKTDRRKNMSLMTRIIIAITGGLIVAALIFTIIFFVIK